MLLVPPGTVHWLPEHIAKMSRIHEALKKAGHTRTPASRSPSLELAYLSGTREGESETFLREFLMIGRGHGNDIALDLFEDRSVSSRHAGIRSEHDGIFLYDFGSLNGTFLNGISVERARLDDGDEIQLGRLGPRIRLNFSNKLPLTPAAGQAIMPDIEDDEGEFETYEVLDSDSENWDRVYDVDVTARKTSRAAVWKVRLLAIIVALLGTKIGLDLMRAFKDFSF